MDTDPRRDPDARDVRALGLAAYRSRSWEQAFLRLDEAAGEGPLGPDDLSTLAMAAFLSGHGDDAVSALERAQAGYVRAGDLVGATRACFWLGFWLAERGEGARASGWLGRAQRLLDRAERDCVERGYLMMPAVQGALAADDTDAADRVAGEAVRIGERFGDADLIALALHAQGRARLRGGRLDEGLRLLDEAMVGVTADEVSPVVAGVVYCSVIAACQEVRALRRAHEWTEALTRWCEGQPELVPFSGQCRVHRSEVLQAGGDWDGALEEARRARERAERGEPPRVAAVAWYQQAELHRQRGDLDEAERAYGKAAELGMDPQPGRALLAWARGDLHAAAATLRRLERETTRPARRGGLLPALAEVALATGDLTEARRALQELEALVERFPTDALAARVAETRGSVALAGGQPEAALVAFRHAWRTWHALEMPFPAARVRWRVAAACRALGDLASAESELAAARAQLGRLGAVTELTRLERELASGAESDRHGLTDRELQVLRALAGGATNRAIAEELSLSPRTVDRHVSNVYDKLGVSTRAAATAYAYRHRLLEPPS